MAKKVMKPAPKAQAMQQMAPPPQMKKGGKPSSMGKKK